MACHFPYLLNPRIHPDDGRRGVRVPTWETFEHVTQFITLRDLAQVWDGVVERALGAGAAGHSGPSGLRGGVLEATADSSAWCQHLQLQRERILAGLAEALGPEAPTDLWFRVG